MYTHFYAKPTRYYLGKHEPSERRALLCADLFSVNAPTVAPSIDPKVLGCMQHQQKPSTQTCLTNHADFFNPVNQEVGATKTCKQHKKSTHALIECLSTDENCVHMIGLQKSVCEANADGFI